MRELLHLVSAITFVFFSAHSIAQDKQVSTEGSVSFSVVRIKNFKYTPNVIEVVLGSTVRWINVDSLDHDVTSGETITGRKSRGLKKTKFPDGMFSSGLFGKDRAFSKTFDEPGVYPYYCNVHPFMTGKVIVYKPKGTN